MGGNPSDSHRAPGNKADDPHLTDEETEAQMGSDLAKAHKEATAGVGPYARVPGSQEWVSLLRSQQLHLKGPRRVSWGA